MDHPLKAEPGVSPLKMVLTKSMVPTLNAPAPARQIN